MTLDPVCAKKKGWCAVRVCASWAPRVRARACISVCHRSHVRENCGKGRGGFRTWSALLPMGWGITCVCVCTGEWVCVCAHLLQQTFIVQRGPLPWLQGFIALKNTDHTEHLVTVTSHWQSCGLKQTDTQSGATMMKEDVRQTGEELSTLGKSHHVHCAGLFSPAAMKKKKEERKKKKKRKTFPVMPNSAGSFRDFPPHLSAYLLLLVKQRGQKQNSLIATSLKRLCSRNTSELSDRQRHILQQQMQTRVQLGRSSQLPLALLDPPWPLSLSFSLSLSFPDQR